MIIKMKIGTISDVKKFVTIASSLESDILVKSKSYVVDGSSIMGLLSLDLSSEVEVELFERDFREKDAFLSKLDEAGFEYDM